MRIFLAYIVVFSSFLPNVIFTVNSVTWTQYTNLGLVVIDLTLTFYDFANQAGYNMLSH